MTYRSNFHMLDMDRGLEGCKADVLKSLKEVGDKQRSHHRLPENKQTSCSQCSFLLVYPLNFIFILTVCSAFSCNWRCYIWFSCVRHKGCFTQLWCQGQCLFSMAYIYFNKEKIVNLHKSLSQRSKTTKDVVTMLLANTTDSNKTILGVKHYQHLLNPYSRRQPRNTKVDLKR